MNLRIYIISLVAMLCMSYSLFAQRVDYSVVSVQEESGTEFTKNLWNIRRIAAD